MIVSLQVHKNITGNRLWHWLFLPVYLIVILLTLKDYIQSGSVNFQAGMVALVISAGINKDRRGSCRFAYAALLALFLYWMIPVKTFMYASLALGILFFIESFAGRMNLVSLLVFVFMSPIFEYAAGVFGFPVRLSITEKVGNILTFTELNASTEGNIILLSGKEFSVDPACMGLHMLVLSMLAGVMLIAVFQKKYQRNLNFLWIVSVLLFITGCNIVSNLLRILCLVYFAIMPSDGMHDVIGLVCFILYIVVPALFITRYIVRKHGVADKKRTVNNSKNYYRLLLSNAIIVLAITLTSAINVHRIERPSAPVQVSDVANYKAEALEDHIIKLGNGTALIYIKPVRGFYSSDHNPMICWQGSGYIFQKVQEETFGGFRVYSADLENKKDRLYTCWWYDNGDHATIGQFSWRWDAFKGGRNYCIVNITSASRAALRQEVEKFRRQKIIGHFMN